MPQYTPRAARPGALDKFRGYLQDRLHAWPELTGSRLLREIRALGYQGGKTILNDYLRQIRPAPVPAFEVHFETPPGH